MSRFYSECQQGGASGSPKNISGGTISDAKFIRGSITGSELTNITIDGQAPLTGNAFLQAGQLTPPAGWDDVPSYSDPALSGAMNGQAKALAARSELLRIDVHEALRRSYAELGYVLRPLPECFKNGGTLTSASDVLLDDVTGIAYTGAGPFPQDVAEDTDPASGGFVARNAEALRTQLTDATGASLVGASGGGTVQESLDRLSAAEVTDKTSLYRYKLLKTLPLNPPLVAGVVAANGYEYLYPQAFSYGRNGDIFVNFASNGQLATWVVKYNSAGAAVSIFNAYAGLSEVTTFYTDGGVDYYVIGGKGALRKFNVTSLPAGESVQTPVSTYTPDVYFGGCKYDNSRMLLEEQATPLGLNTHRNRLFVFNHVTGLREHSVTLPFQITGAASGADYDTILHKTQGFAVSPDGVYLSHGAFAVGTETDIHTATGISLASWQGTTKTTALITAKTMFDFLVSRGKAATRVENEGVTIGSDGFPHVLHIYLDADSVEATTEGITICSVGEPFGYTDLSHGAIAPLTATYYGKSLGGLRNPYTGEIMDTMKKIMEYMIATDKQEFHFYTSTATVTDIDGSAFPGSTMVRIYNQNNTTFFWETINGGTQTWWNTADLVTKNYMSFLAAGPKADISNTVGGSGSGRLLTTGNGNTILGNTAGQQVTTGLGNTLIGQNAGRDGVAFNNNSHLGRHAGRYQLDGATSNLFDNTTCLGYDTRVSGANQVQLGNSATTTYVYGTVQSRSDVDDKTGVRNTTLGIDYIMGLRPVDYRWDMRDDYFEEYEEQIGEDEDGNPIIEIMRRAIPKDGSKARTRYHHGFIAQEVKALSDRLGVDFGGFQDHSVNGGANVRSLGYDEFIAPAVKAIQQCWERMDAIEARLTAGGL